MLAALLDLPAERGEQRVRVLGVAGEALDPPGGRSGELGRRSADRGDVLPARGEEQREFAAHALRAADDDRVLARSRLRPQSKPID